MIKFTKQYLENIFFILFTFLLSPLFYFFIFICKYKRNKTKKPLKFLVIQTAKIGDVVCSTPVFREIKKHYPESFLSVLVIPLVKDILINNPYIDEIILLDRKKYFGIKGVLKLIKEIKAKNFNWSFSLLPGILNNIIPFWAGISNRVATTSKYATKTTKIVSIFSNYKIEYKRHKLALGHYLNLLKFIGIPNTDQKKEIFITEEQKEKTSQFLKKHNLKQEEFLVGISVTAGKDFKEWAPNKFSQLADRITDRLKARVIFIGSKNDKIIIEKIQSLMNNRSLKITEFNLIELASLLRKFSLFISVDTGPLYIANTLGVPVVDIAGPCSMESQCPTGKKIIIVKKEINCYPCSFISSAPSYCKEGHKRCIKEISVNDVYIAVKKMLKYIK